MKLGQQDRRIERETKVCLHCHQVYERKPNHETRSMWATRSYCSAECSRQVRRIQREQKACECGGQHYAKGLCHRCYTKHRRQAGIAWGAA